MEGEGERRGRAGRWDRCDVVVATVPVVSAPTPSPPSTRQRALDALDDDRYLIAWLVVCGLFVAHRVSRYRRWRTAAWVGAALTIGYALADLHENRLLHDLLAGKGYDGDLPAVEALKWGLLSGVAILLLVSVSLVAAGRPEVRLPRLRLHALVRARAALHQTWRAFVAFILRWLRRLRPTKASAPVAGVAGLPTVRAAGGTGISCSGGGIRSAAFTLGSLQSMDKAPSVLKSARWLTAVSGGSYMAAAWVTARDAVATGGDAVWSRQSPEEDHLRRHSSYLAPGIGGKLWALSRFLFGFAVNLGLVVVFLAVVSLPAGWAIGRSTAVEGLGGKVSLPEGGCLVLPKGDLLVVLPNPDLRVVTADTPIVGDGVAVPPVKASESSATAEVKGHGSATIAVDGAAEPTKEPDPPSPADVCAPRAAAPAVTTPGIPPAKLEGQRFKQGTQVPLQLTPPGREVEVKGFVAACREPAGAGRAQASPPCDVALATYRQLPKGTALVGAPIALLTLDHSATVRTSGGPPTLVQRCGTEECRRWELPAPIWWLVVVPSGLAVLLGLELVLIRRPDRPRRRRERWLRWSMSVAALTALGGWLIPTVVVWLPHLSADLEDQVGLVGGSTLTMLGALLAQISAASPKDDASSSTTVRWVKKAGTKLRPVLVKVASRIVGPLLLIGLSLTFMVSGVDGASGAQILTVVILTEVLVYICLAGDLNEWSLHPFYRDQLKSAFAVDQRADTPLGQPLPRPRTDPLEDLNRTDGPDLVICATGNIADDRITSPGRPAVSWMFSRDAIGSMAIEAATGSGTYQARRAAGELPAPRLDLDRRGRFRCGVLPGDGQDDPAGANAVRAGEPASRRLVPEPALLVGLRSAEPEHPPRSTGPGIKPITRGRGTSPRRRFGLHRLRDPWVYVTDGGHYENLGLVELLRRGCDEIYCFDAAGDSARHVRDAGRRDADRARRARDRDRPRPHPDEARQGRRVDLDSVCGPASSRYPEDRHRRWIVVGKLAVPGDAPFDIIDLARTLHSFPTPPDRRPALHRPEVRGLPRARWVPRVRGSTRRRGHPTPDRGAGTVRGGRRARCPRRAVPGA